MNIYYVYVYYDSDGVPFYVGYGKNNRMYDHLNEAKKKLSSSKNQRKLNKIRKMLREGIDPTIEVVKDNLSREEACNLEIELIEKFGRADLGLGPLTNMTRGGDGTVDWSDELRKKISDKKKGTTVAKNIETGEYIQASISDPRWGSGEIVGVNSGKSGVTNKNGALNNYILAKDIETGEIVRVKSYDERWLSNKLVGINKDKPCHENTRIATSNRWKGIPKSKEHNMKNSESMKQLKWYCNFQSNKVGRFRENEQPDGYIRVSGPHKRKIL
jgi:hypothetical protein